MVVEKLSEINPPSGRVPGQVLLALPILKSRRRRSRVEYHEKGFLPRVSMTGSKYRPKGAPEVVPTSQSASWRGQEGDRAHRAPGRGVPPPNLLRCSRVFRYA